jgi:hypothetical protein
MKAQTVPDTSGLVPGTYALLAAPKKDVGGRDNPRIKSGDGHDSENPNAPP